MDEKTITLQDVIKFIEDPNTPVRALLAITEASNKAVDANVIAVASARRRRKGKDESAPDADQSSDP